MKKDIDSKKAFAAEFEGKTDQPEQRVDEAWCSESCKKKIRDTIFAKYPCKQKFSQVDVAPLYAEGAQRFYRVTLWVNDWSTNSFCPAKEIWKTFYVTLEGMERTIVSIEEGRKRKLGIGENGLKLMDELGVSSTTKE